MWLLEVHQSLDDGVVGGIHFGAQREVAATAAEVSLELFGRYHPVVHMQLLEVHGEIEAFARLRWSI